MTDRDTSSSFLIALLAPRRGESILDLGCGAGNELEQILRGHPDVRVVGVDHSERAIRAARRRLSRYVKRGMADLVPSDARKRLPFPPGSFHAVLSAELMECIPPPDQKRLLKEVHRVLRPRGRFIMAHTDWDTQIWNARDRELERRLVHAFCDWTQGWMEASDGWMGRKLLGLLRQSRSFTEIQAGAFPRIEERYRLGSFGYARAQDLLTLARKNGRVEIAEAKRFLRDLASQDRAGTYFYSVTRYVVTARAR